MQEQIHHQEHQDDRFHQGLDHFLDRDLDEFRGVVRNGVCDAGREVLGQLCHLGVDCSSSAQRVGSWRQLHADEGRRFAVEAAGSRIRLTADFDTSNIAQTHDRAICIGAQLDIAELFDGSQLPGCHHGCRNLLRPGARQIAKRTARNQCILRCDCSRHVGWRQAEANQFDWIDPDPHGAFSTEQLCLADAWYTFDFVENVT